MDLGNGWELRLFEERHAEELFRVIDRNRDHLRPWFPWVDRSRSVEDARFFIATSTEQYGIFADGALAGAVGMHKIDAANRSTAIGYWLDCRMQGRGMMTSACRVVVTHAFREHRLHRVEIRCGTENVRSAAVARRLGFVEEGVLRDAEWVNDRFLDLVIWGMLSRIGRCELDDMSEFSGKNVLVTGGTSGIGLAVVEGFRQAGATVIAPELTELDVASDEDVARVVGGLDRLDYLVNSAGMIARDAEFEIPVFLRVLDVNLSGTMRLCAACKHLLPGGAIVNIASVLSWFGGPRVPAYSASKGGVAQLTRALAVAWAKDGIRVNAVAPGWIATGFTQALQEDPQRSAQLMGRTPMARWGRPEEIAAAVIFLCSQGASFITGGGDSGGWRVLGRLTLSTSTHQLSPAQIVATAIPDDERVWVPQAPDVWFRPLMLNTLAGSWCNLLRVRKAGILSRHRHPAPVHGYVIKGSWRYLEHDWTARAGDYVFEPPGETHTLYVPEDVEEMITFFQISGCMYYVDEHGDHTGFEDVFTKIDMCRKHYIEVNLGADYVDQFVR